MAYVYVREKHWRGIPTKVEGRKEKMLDPSSRISVVANDQCCPDFCPAFAVTSGRQSSAE